MYIHTCTTYASAFAHADEVWGVSSFSVIFCCSFWFRMYSGPLRRVFGLVNRINIERPQQLTDCFNFIEHVCCSQNEGPLGSAHLHCPFPLPPSPLSLPAATSGRRAVPYRPASAAPRRRPSPLQCKSQCWPDIGRPPLDPKRRAAIRSRSGPPPLMGPPLSLPPEAPPIPELGSFPTTPRDLRAH